MASKKKLTAQTSLSMRDAIRLAERLGCIVGHQGGDYMISHRPTNRRIRVNSRRKDVPRALVTFLRKIESR